MENLIDINQLTKEILVSSDMFGKFWNICVWDHKTGTNLQTYKNSSTVPHGLAFLKNDYMLCAIHNKPYVIYWNLKGKTNSNKINTPNYVNCLCVTSCGNYICLGVEEKVYVLQAHSGYIVSIISKHYQNLSCIKISSNDRYLITASEDTVIYVWDFYDILNLEKEYLKPKFTWSSHSMKINDLYVSSTSDRVISASSDQSCKFWNLLENNSFPTDTILFESSPNRCILDNLESYFYVGLVNGDILRLSIKKIKQYDKFIQSKMENKRFIGHKQTINCLAITSDDYTLASGSDDSTIRIWDTISKQCVKVLNQSGSITNLTFKNRTFFFNDEQNTATPLFSKYTNESEKAISTDTVITTAKYTNKLGMSDFIESGLNDNCQEEYFELKCKYENMKKINEKIYNFAIDKILNS